jgi:hypothetical protein
MLVVPRAWKSTADALRILATKQNVMRRGPMIRRSNDRCLPIVSGVLIVANAGQLLTWIARPSGVRPKDVPPVLNAVVEEAGPDLPEAGAAENAGEAGNIV